MKTIKEEHRGLATVLTFALIPLSGLATDVYLPSLPSMATAFHASNEQVQLSLLIFLVTAGICQLFVGSLLDSFGRYWLSNIALLIFAVASFVIAAVPSLAVLYAMRVVHGITVAIIVVAKRAYFMDSFSGDRLRNYTSMFSIVWATAPIIAPFLGGYLQKSFGWESNFYFLGGFTLVVLVLTLIYGGESIRNFQPFAPKTIVEVYRSMIKTRDYSFGLVIIGLSYSMLMIFGMTSPFIIEHVYHFTPVNTGYSALISGVSLMAGGMVSKSMISKPLEQKIPVALLLQLLASACMIVASYVFIPGIFVMMSFVIVLHLLAGFVFNSLFAYCLGRFSSHAGIVSGLTGGGLYVITSVFSYTIVHLLHIKTQGLLGIAYLTLSVLSLLSYSLFQRSRTVAQGALLASE